MVTQDQIRKLEQQEQELIARCMEETRRMVESGGAYPQSDVQLEWNGALNGYARIRVTLPHTSYIHRIRI